VDSVADLWPVFGLFIQTPRLRLPREEELCELARAARVIARAGNRSCTCRGCTDRHRGMERQFLQRYWRALAHWKPESWHRPLAIYLDGRPIGAGGNYRPGEEFATVLEDLLTSHHGGSSA
jgi:hypothetical protein